jgi:hypothetical protein
MIRGLLFFFIILVIYSALKAVLRSVFKAHREDEPRHGKRIMGDEMVLDPECNTYVVKDRAVTRRIRGTLTHFCSDACAGQYEDKNRA